MMHPTLGGAQGVAPPRLGAVLYHIPSTHVIARRQALPWASPLIFIVYRYREIILRVFPLPL